mgnify:CR=1 FL=1
MSTKNSYKELLHHMDKINALAFQARAIIDNKDRTSKKELKPVLAAIIYNSEKIHSDATTLHNYISFLHFLFLQHKKGDKTTLEFFAAFESQMLADCNSDKRIEIEKKRLSA